MGATRAASVLKEGIKSGKNLKASISETIGKPLRKSVEGQKLNGSQTISENSLKILGDGGLNSRKLLTSGANKSVAPKTKFYVTEQGIAIPSKGYRFMDSKYAKQTIESMEAPGSYIGFDDFQTASKARDAFQISSEWSNARLKGEFDTLQIVDDITIPLEKGGKGPNLEPITISYPEYGKGGYRQAYTQKRLKFNKVTLLEEK